MYEQYTNKVRTRYEYCNTLLAGRYCCIYQVLNNKKKDKDISAKQQSIKKDEIIAPVTNTVYHF